jgi:hypothetical protein
VLKKLGLIGQLDRDACMTHINDMSLTFARDNLRIPNGSFSWQSVSAASDVIVHDSTPLLDIDIDAILKA